MFVHFVISDIQDKITAKVTHVATIGPTFDTVCFSYMFLHLYVQFTLKFTLFTFNF